MRIKLTKKITSLHLRIYKEFNEITFILIPSIRNTKDEFSFQFLIFEFYFYK